MFKLSKIEAMVHHFHSVKFIYTLCEGEWDLHILSCGSWMHPVGWNRPGKEEDDQLEE